MAENGSLSGTVVVQIPSLEDAPTRTSPLRDVTVWLESDDQAPISGKTDGNGKFAFRDLAPGTYTLRLEKELTSAQGLAFQLDGPDRQEVKIPTGKNQNRDVTVDPATYAIRSSASVPVGQAPQTTNFPGGTWNTGPMSNGVVGDGGFSDVRASISGIEAVLREFATFPFTGPSSAVNGVQTTSIPTRGSGTGVRSNVDSIPAEFGLDGNLTDEGLAEMFPADGDATYRWSGPLSSRRSVTRATGSKHATVRISGALAWFQQQARTAQADISRVLATIQPFNGHDVDPETLKTQKQIVLQTLSSIVSEPERPEGVRNIAIDLHFQSLLYDEIIVDLDRTTVYGSLGVLEHLLGISDALIDDQDAEIYMTGWQQVRAAAKSAEAAWENYKNPENVKELRFGERLQELHGLFGALSEASIDARAMLRTVRFTPQEQASHKFVTSSYGSLTTDDLLSMVEELATDIGPTFITDWRGRGIASLLGRATSLRDTTDELISKDEFPFNLERVKLAFMDLVRLLHETALVCATILTDMLPEDAPSPDIGQVPGGAVGSDIAIATT